MHHSLTRSVTALRYLPRAKVERATDNRATWWWVWCRSLFCVRTHKHTHAHKISQCPKIPPKSPRNDPLLAAPTQRRQHGYGGHEAWGGVWGIGTRCTCRRAAEESRTGRAKPRPACLVRVYILFAFCYLCSRAIGLSSTPLSSALSVFLPPRSSLPVTTYILCTRRSSNTSNMCSKCWASKAILDADTQGKTDSSGEWVMWWGDAAAAAAASSRLDTYSVSFTEYCCNSCTCSVVRSRKLEKSRHILILAM